MFTWLPLIININGPYSKQASKVVDLEVDLLVDRTTATLISGAKEHFSNLAKYSSKRAKVYSIICY